MPDPPSFDLILAAETRRMPPAADGEDHRRRYGDDSHDAEGSPVDVHQAALFNLGFLAFFFFFFLGLGRASNRGSSG